MYHSLWGLDGPDLSLDIAEVEGGPVERWLVFIILD